MKKRIVSILLSILMLISIIPISSVFAAETTSIIITADKVTAYPDDFVDFTVSVGSVKHLMGAEFKVIIPSGMTYISGSASVADNLRTTLSCASADWTESSMKFTMYGDGDYSSDNNTKILTLSCKIDSTASGTLVPQITDIVLSNTEFEEISAQVIDDAGTVSVKTKPVSATGVFLNKSILSLATGETETLIATVSPENATNKAVSWASSDASVATVDNNGKVTAIKNGTATVTVTTADGSYTDACSVSVACSHANTTIHPAKASTCLVQGNDEYTTCDDCGIVVSGSNAKLPLANHTYVEKTESYYLKTTATCVSKAVYYKSCSVCGAKSNETFTYGEVDPDNHTGSTYIVAQKEATCYEEGYTGDTYCSDCNVKIASGTVIKKNAHNPTSVWSTDENCHWKECQTVGCGNIIDKATHSGGEATCTKKAVCTVCGTEYGTVDANNHKNTEIRSAVEATCTVDGYTGDTYCSDCGAKLSEGKIISAGHKLDKLEANAATHYTNGNIEYYICSTCGKLFKDASGMTEITTEDTVIAKGEHDYGDTYQMDAENHWKKCGCGNIIEKASHTFGDWTVVKETSDTENGLKERICTVCGYKATEIIPVIGTVTEPTNPVESGKQPTVPLDMNTNEPTEKPIQEEDTNQSNQVVKDNSEKSPQTGASSDITIWIVLISFSAVTLIIIPIFSRKRRVK